MSDSETIKRFRLLKRAKWIEPGSLTLTVHLGPDGWYAHAYDDAHGPDNPIMYSCSAICHAKGNNPWHAVKRLLTNTDFEPIDESEE